MGAAEIPTPPWVSTRGSCSAVEPTQYSGQYELLVDGDPPRIVVVGRVLEGGQIIHGVPILPQHVRVTIDEVRDPQAQVPVPTPEINFVGEVIGSFIVWPRALIMSHIATPQFIRPQKQPIHDTVIHEDDDMAEAEDDPLSKLMTRLPRVIGKSRGQLVQILYPKLDSWECGFYVMCWIKTIIRAVITDDWNERFKSTSPIPEDTIRQIRQEWTAYLLQRWRPPPLQRKSSLILEYTMVNTLSFTIHGQTLNISYSPPLMIHFHAICRPPAKASPDHGGTYSSRLSLVTRPEPGSDTIYLVLQNYADSLSESIRSASSGRGGFSVKGLSLSEWYALSELLRSGSTVSFIRIANGCAERVS
ncbi:hypothetical protein LR48_Vigan454s000300 [Vigna angularis]|uniref:DUF8039 domain-containing protein n=1 Tax=Phaseolus angularis TaxID=3914 RepID=A0A0L9TC45_PHAAN|nr:hypothetical protein LR48_Vigan454s000300 [Vigna angularis]